MTIAIVIVVGVIGVGLAASQLMRLKSYLSRPAPVDPPDTDPE